MNKEPVENDILLLVRRTNVCMCVWGNSEWNIESYVLYTITKQQLYWLVYVVCYFHEPESSRWWKNRNDDTIVRIFYSLRVYQTKKWRKLSNRFETSYLYFDDETSSMVQVVNPQKKKRTKEGKISMKCISRGGETKTRENGLRVTRIRSEDDLD